LTTAAIVATLSGEVAAGEQGAAPQRRSYWPGAARFKQAALDALRDPITWGPAAGALVFRVVDDWDRKVSDWAIDKTPVFGSPGNAASWSDDLRTATRISAALTAVVAPNEDRPWGSWASRLGWGEAAAYLTEDLTGRLKEATDRERPNRIDRRSFPSGHASVSFAYSTMAAGHIDMMRFPVPVRTGLKIGTYGFASGVAWARVEAGWHYPSDVLAGAALGHFLGTFLHDAFLGPDPRTSLVTAFDRDDRYILVAVRF
jgi:membrane-associated phospholipid phosphatase